MSHIYPIPPCIYHIQTKPIPSNCQTSNSKHQTCKLANFKLQTQTSTLQTYELQPPSPPKEIKPPPKIKHSIKISISLFLYFFLISKKKNPSQVTARIFNLHHNPIKSVFSQKKIKKQKQNICCGIYRTHARTQPPFGITIYPHSHFCPSAKQKLSFHSASLVARLCAREKKRLFTKKALWLGGGGALMPYCPQNEQLEPSFWLNLIPLLAPICQLSITRLKRT